MKVKVTYSHIWWPILGIRALNLPIQVHTHSSEHTHLEKWATIYVAAPGEQFGVLLKGIGIEESAVHSLPPTTIPAGPRLELTTFRLWVWLFTIRPRLPLQPSATPVWHELPSKSQPQTSNPQTVAYTSDACGTQKYKCFRSRYWIGWIIQDFQETCVPRSLTFRLETKMPSLQTPSWKKKAIMFTTVMLSTYQDQLNAEFSKVCEIFKVRTIEFLIYILEFYTLVCYSGDISTSRNVTLNETNCDWLFDMLVKWPPGRPWPIKAAMDSRHSSISKFFEFCWNVGRGTYFQWGCVGTLHIMFKTAKKCVCICEKCIDVSKTLQHSECKNMFYVNVARGAWFSDMPLSTWMTSSSIAMTGGGIWSIWGLFWERWRLQDSRPTRRCVRLGVWRSDIWTSTWVTDKCVPKLIRLQPLKLVRDLRPKRWWDSFWGWWDTMEGLCLIIHTSPAHWLISLKRKH